MPPALGHVSMMHDALLANLPADDLRSIVRALLAQGVGNSTVAQTFAALARERCRIAKAGETISDAQRRARLLFSAGEPVLALDLLGGRVVPGSGELSREEQTRLDHDLVQAVQAAKEAHLEGSSKEQAAAAALTQLRQALQRVKTASSSFALQRGLQAAMTWSPSFCPAPAAVETKAAQEGTLQIAQTRFPTFRLGTQEVPRVFCGLWQLSSPSWGSASPEQIREALETLVKSGFTAFDMADHYGDAELVIGRFRALLNESTSIYAATKWCVFKPLQVTAESVRHGLEERKSRLASVPDLVQFHWQDWKDQQYVKALQHMLELRQEGVLREVGLCNFDTAKTDEVCSALPAGSIVSNQVQFSLVDSRPLFGMCDVCEKHGVKLLTYGSLCGGFLADKWLGKAEPDVYSVGFTPSLRKYRDMIEFWGGWTLFQELLRTLSAIAERHRVSIANVATRWVLQQRAVGAVIIGARLGVSSNVDDNAHVFDFELDSQDLAHIDAVLKRSNASKLFEEVGDCGGEYR